MSIRVDGKPLDPGVVHPDTPLIRVLEKTLQVDGLRKRCRNSNCGGCTVLLDGQPVKACATPWSEADGRDIQTLGNESGQSAG